MELNSLSLVMSTTAHAEQMCLVMEQGTINEIFTIRRSVVIPTKFLRGNIDCFPVVDSEFPE